jgi:two-component system, OmpR family, copper resistance phosphate regulon response regulator CusR
MAIQEDYDVIILDIMLPSINGLEVCEQLRKEQVRVPIIMLSALGTVDDKVEGLQRGADDYMVKPFHFKELLSRIHALTRRNNKNIYTTSSLSFADLHLDRERKIAIRGKKEIILTAKEYGLLELFIVNSNRVLSRSFIAEKVWGNDFDASSNVIDVLINYLRNKIDKGFPNKLIHTVVGMGYSMKES